jgi:hypothetical protein
MRACVYFPRGFLFQKLKKSLFHVQASETGLSRLMVVACNAVTPVWFWKQFEATLVEPNCHFSVLQNLQLSRERASVPWQFHSELGAARQARREQPPWHLSCDLSPDQLPWPRIKQIQKLCCTQQGKHQVGLKQNREKKSTHGTLMGPCGEIFISLRLI